MTTLASVPERRATFREERRFAALTDTLLSTGHLLYRRPAYLEKVTDWPEKERLVVDGDRMVLTEGNDAPRVVGLDVQPGLRAMVDGLRGPLAGDLGALQRSFTVEASGSAAAWTLDLLPRDPAAGRLLRSIHVAGQSGEIHELRLVQANGDQQWMQIGPSA